MESKNYSVLCIDEDLTILEFIEDKFKWYIFELFTVHKQAKKP